MIDPTVFFVSTTILLGDQLFQSFLDGRLSEVEVAEVGVLSHAFIKLKKGYSVVAGGMSMFEEFNEQGID